MNVTMVVSRAFGRFEMNYSLSYFYLMDTEYKTRMHGDCRLQYIVVQGCEADERSQQNGSPNDTSIACMSLIHSRLGYKCMTDSNFPPSWSSRLDIDTRLVVLY